LSVRPAWSGFESDNELVADSESDLVDIRTELTLALTHLDKAVTKAQESSDPTAKHVLAKTVGIRESVLTLIRRLPNR